MFIFWGYPNDGTSECINSTVSSFDDCITSCQSSTTCMLAYGNDSICMLCDMFLVTSISTSDSENGMKTGVKVDVPDDGCPGSMTSESYTNTAVNDPYTLTYSNGEWIISYVNKSCLDDTWTKFYRPLGQWCMKVYGSSSLLTRTSASTNCVSLNSSLSAIQSANELDFISARASNLTGKLSAYTYTGVWMDGIRYGTCNFNGAEDTAACTGMKMFALTDPYISSTDQYTFVPNQPDSTVDRGSRHNCLAVLISQTASSYQGLTYNALCTYSCNAANTICMTTYVCGIAAN